MLKSMTGFSKTEAKENGITAVVEIKSLNGKYLDINCRLPRQLYYKELEIRELIKQALTRGSVSINVNITRDSGAQPFNINEESASHCFESLKSLQKKLNIREALKFEHLLQFANHFAQAEENDNSEEEWKLTKTALKEALKSLDRMRSNEGRQISKDLQLRMKKISQTVEKIEALGIQKIPEERERLRQRVGQLFESDEIDERRIQLEIVLLSDKLDISEECVRMRSHIKFFFEALKVKEPVGRKVNFLMQEMNREINTIGSKANDIEISHLVVETKEELERVREQFQNVE